MIVPTSIVQFATIQGKDISTNILHHSSLTLKKKVKVNIRLLSTYGCSTWNKFWTL